MRDGAKRAIGVMPLVKVEPFGEGLEPDIGLLNRMVQRRVLGCRSFLRSLLFALNFIPAHDADGSAPLKRRSASAASKEVGPSAV